MFDLISIGDVTIDNYVQIHEARVEFNIDKTKRMLCMEYGDKIPVDHLSHQVAGNAANSAVGGARLKLKTAAYVNVGDDLSGKQMKDKLKDEGVDTRYVMVNKGIESNLSTVINFKGERTILVYHQAWKYHLPDLEKARWVYFTSLSVSFLQSNILKEVESYVETGGAKLLYNPGTYQLKAGVKKNPRFLSLTEVLVVNMQEAKMISTGHDDVNIPIKKLLQDIVDLGPKMAVITDGTEGSYGYDGENFYYLDIFPAKIVERTGAGDAYASGLLAALFYGKELKEAMRWGTANGAAVVEVIGPQPGLLTYEKMQEKLKINSKIQPKII